jgi:PAS domain S-box-containing protein
MSRIDKNVGGVLAGVLVLNAFVCGLIAWVLFQSHRQYQDRAILVTANLARVLDNNLSSLIDKIDMTLRTTVNELEWQSGSHRIDHATIEPFLALQRSLLPGTVRLRVTNAQGLIEYGVAEANVTIFDRDYFTYLREHPDAGAYLTTPFVGRIVSKPIIILARRYRKPDGSFAGIVQAAVELETLTAILASVELPRGGGALWDEHSRLVLRSNLPDAPVNPAAPPSPALAKLIASHAPPTAYRARSLVDNTDRQMYFRKLSRWPFYLVVGIGNRDALAGWKREAGYLSGLAFLFLLASSLVAAKALRNLNERKRSEATLQRLNRECRAISNCNQVLMRAKDEPLLLETLCRIVCHEAGYCLAWVGYVEHDPDQTLRVAAWAGEEADYLKAGRLTWADTEWGRGPSGRAVRTGHPVCFQDLDSEPDFAPWRAEARKRGYRAMLALPLCNEEAQPLGVMGIYSTQAQAFTPEEIRLLEELAGDLAFGITVLRAREKHKGDEAFVAARERDYRALAEFSPDSIVRYDRDCRALYANTQYKTALSVTDAAVLGRTPMELAVQERHRGVVLTETERFHALLGQVIATGQAANMELQVLDGAGEMRVHSIRFTPERDAEGGIVGALAFGRDITEQQKTEEQLRQAQKMEAVGQLAGGVAHDFNNILTAIMGFANLVKLKLKPEDPLQSFIDQILVSSDRAAHLTHGLLAFSRKQVMLPRSVDLDGIVKNVESLLRRLIGEDIDLAIRLSGTNLTLMADPGQIEQVLMNLATNARDAMPRGGRLAISTEMKVLGKELLCAQGFPEAGRYGLITVADTGIGMNEATRAKIFEPFFTTKEQGKGTGLGLSIAYGIIKQHNGTLNVYSEPGKGTTFRIYLPLVDSALEEDPPTLSAELLGGSETLLLAEDDPDVRTLASTVLRSFGYQVIEAADGLEVLEQCKTCGQRVDLLILDVIMPRMSGREAFDLVRAFRPDAKALFISGYTADALSTRGLFTDTTRFLSKPMSPAELLRTVRAILDGVP